MPEKINKGLNCPRFTSDQPLRNTNAGTASGLNRAIVTFIKLCVHVNEGS